MRSAASRLDPIDRQIERALEHERGAIRRVRPEPGDVRAQDVRRNRERSFRPDSSKTTVVPGCRRWLASSICAPPADRSISATAGPYFSRASFSQVRSASVWRV